MSDLPSSGSTDGTESASGTLRRLESDEAGDSCCDDPILETRRADDETVAAELAVFKTLANEKRLRIVEALRGGELCACELEAILDAPQSTVSSHLSRLREAGIVNTRKEGKWTYYRIADTASLQLLDLAAALGDDS
ncbi:ArsR family transcriptional regulator [Halobiforma haloterrestris]|uniref:ArsR family transcriptional regulator n=1 Tax=Natronobacterium haloterrestre TaxID=148448 RepID=A0A1I1H7P9_NATHA|nr:metalloregulator ArsR/SmtB family transcription factor [Halobiforma haloterrestris]SFC19984.1 ArsR family transcriptional regulator [Halobiforma haloterrestris]